MKTKPKASVYIDGANLFYAQQKMGWFIDWTKLKAWLENQFKVLEIKYYTGIKANDKKADKFNLRIKNYGYKICTKPLKKITIDKNNYFYKVNFDVEIAVDMIMDYKQYDTVILFSGDSDFEYVIKKLQKLNKKVIVCCSRKAMSKELYKVSDNNYLIGNLRNELEFK